MNNLYKERGYTMKISDESLIANLVKYGSHKRTADELGISMNTITNRLKNESFRQRYEMIKAEILQESVNCMKSQLTNAVITLSEVMNDKSNPATVRISAADSLLRHAVRYIETAEIERRIHQLEIRDNNNDKFQ